MKKILLLLTITVIFGCVEKPPEPTELYNDYRKSVVLIKNSYYFQTTLDNGFEFYYTIENNKPIFYDKEGHVQPLSATLTFVEQIYFIWS